MIDKTLLITRPKGDGAALTDALHAIGAHVVHEPLIEIVLLHDERTAVERALAQEPDAIILTSRHGAQALALLSQMRDPALLCIGEATAEMARSLGFTRVSTAGGNAQSILDYVAASYDHGARFLYLSGRQVRVPLEALLSETGFPTERLALYDALPSEELSETVIEHIKRKNIDGVALMSPRTAQIFLALLAKAGLQQQASHLTVFALSDAVAEPLQLLQWQGVHVAPEATLASLVECIDNAFG